MQRKMRFVIPRERAGATALDFLLARFPYHDRAGWTDELVAGRVRVNGCCAEPGLVLSLGDVVEYRSRDVPEPFVRLDVRIVFEDAHLLVVDKPPNLPCHPGGRYFNHTLWAWLKQEHRVADPVFVNRLDRETSGLVVVAASAAAAKNLRAQFAARRVTKRYLALVEGLFPAELSAAGWLVPDTGAVVRKRRLFVPGAPDAAAPDGAEPAETAFRLVRASGGVSLVEAVPATGRLHQIRATLHALGFPVVGDKLYGVDPAMFIRFCDDTLSDEDRRRLRMDRQALHAAGLKFVHPRTGKSLAFELDLPADMAAVIGPFAL